MYVVNAVNCQTKGFSRYGKVFLFPLDADRIGCNEQDAIRVDFEYNVDQ